MPLYFIRHGESHANEQNRFAGRLNTPLTDLGLHQARQAAERVAALGVRLDEVHVSPLGRARQTAEIIIDRQPERPASLTVIEALLERDFGVFSGRNKSLVKKSIGFAGYAESFHSHTGCPPGGESWTAMYRRTADYYHDVLLPASQSGRTVLVVAHKYIIEILAVIVSGVRPEEYRDLKIPNARPLSEDDLRRAASAPNAAALLNDLGEVVEIHLPLLVVASAGLGVAGQLLAGVHVTPWVFSSVMTVLLAIGSFFALLRVDPQTLQGGLRSFRPAMPLLLIRLPAGLLLLWTVHSAPLELAGLFLLLPPALIAPSLSLLWGGDYFFAVRHTIAASLALPVVLLGSIALPLSLPGTHGPRLGSLEPALVTYGVVLLTALVVPGIGAQALRRHNPIRAGSLSTNWNWLGGLALVPLAGLATFALTPAAGFGQRSTLTSLVTTMAITGIGLATLRLLTMAALRLQRPATSLGRDIFITQNTPNIFLWLAMTAILAPSAGDRPSVIGLGAALVFFLALYIDERFFLHSHSRDLRMAQQAAAE